MNSTGHPRVFSGCPFRNWLREQISLWGGISFHHSLSRRTIRYETLDFSFAHTSLCGLISAQEHSASHQSKQATLVSGLGDLHHPVSTSNVEAQQFFDQGLRLIYGFNHDEAYQWRRTPDKPCGWTQSKHGLHPLQCTHQALERIRIKIKMYLDPAPARQHHGQPTARFVLRRRFLGG